MIKDGLHTEWRDNGQKKLEVTYKDGKLDGLGTWWNDNGQKEMERTSKDGELDGLETHWYGNGQKKEEFTWKVGMKMEIKYSIINSIKPHLRGVFCLWDDALF